MANHCAFGRRCVWWVEKYLGDCVCGVRDYVSVGLGLTSVFCWAVAEVPQIITNFKNGSTEGVSLGFLMAWVVGDLFNLAGCFLEPATLPTQFYTALLYTITTIILVLQIIYFDYICKWWKVRKTKVQAKNLHKEVFKSDKNDNQKAEPVEVPENTNTLPIPAVSSRDRSNTGRDLYYMSARSLASSHTPTSGSYMLQGRRISTSYTINQPSLDQEGLLTNLISPSPVNSNTILRSVASIIFFVGGLNYLNSPTYNYIASRSPYSVQMEEKSVVIITGRKLLQGMVGSAMQEESSSQLGTWLGWIMTAIYMGGRLPQIRLNIKRGTVEGLDPFMFMFAVLANTTYVGSILVRSLEWKNLKPNMPWLVDAAACVVLDLFILAQFIYYNIRRSDDQGDADGAYEAAKT
ncbi:probable vacuolar amino acid transporter YPQ1 isoform X1 [Cryptomeria japonica]|uniref:probable vacuolar amino acid transporter YPQ1 isoform X1 n=2 Tax=Cryptomeria japonica TaxID=3369 RepID=UPI0025ABFFF9|nr:probable vacuolar amino acid transporter YPQ1 isoform X1 [Cryptomeria japonica]